MSTLVIHGERIAITDIDFEVVVPAPGRPLFVDFEVEKDALVTLDPSSRVRQRKSIVPVVYFECDPEGEPVTRKLSLIPVDSVIQNNTHALTAIGVYRLPTGALVALLERTPVA